MKQVLFIAGVRTSGVLNAQSSPGRYFKAGNPRLSHSKLLPCPGRISTQWTHAAAKLLGLICGGFPSSSNTNKREVTALIGFINSIWNKLCLMTGCEPPGHHWARRLRLVEWRLPAGPRAPGVPSKRPDEWGGWGRGGVERARLAN